MKWRTIRRNLIGKDLEVELLPECSHDMMGDVGELQEDIEELQEDDKEEETQEEQDRRLMKDIQDNLLKISLDLEQMKKGK